jgi:hypothetical protein
MVSRDTWVLMACCGSAPVVSRSAARVEAASLLLPKRKFWEAEHHRSWRKYLNFLAIPAGLEPATYCLEGSCSIQLSYGTVRGATAAV